MGNGGEREEREMERRREERRGREGRDMGISVTRSERGRVREKKRKKSAVGDTRTKHDYNSIHVLDHARIYIYIYIYI